VKERGNSSCQKRGSDRKTIDGLVGNAAFAAKDGPEITIETETIEELHHCREGSERLYSSLNGKSKLKASSKIGIKITPAIRPEACQSGKQARRRKARNGAARSP
jgi:hypothetical protein